MVDSDLDLANKEKVLIDKNLISPTWNMQLTLLFKNQLRYF